MESILECVPWHSWRSSHCMCKGGAGEVGWPCSWVGWGEGGGEVVVYVSGKRLLKSYGKFHRFDLTTFDLEKDFESPYFKSIVVVKAQ